MQANRIARWDGDAWSTLGSGMNADILAMTVFDDGAGDGPALYAGGIFTSAGGMPASRIARWNGTSWSSLGANISTVVYALAVFDDGTGGGPALYIGGGFSTAGGVLASHIAKWDGTSWAALDGGVNNFVRALAVFDDGSGERPALYAGGDFTVAGGALASRIARWNGASWSPLGDGVNGTVRALEVFDDGSGIWPGGWYSGRIRDMRGRIV
jgi:hypothetical protein